MRYAAFAAGGLLAATGIWTVVLAAASSDRTDVAVILLSVSLWTHTVVALTGMLVARARWARRLAMAVAAAQGAVALLLPPGGWWGVGLVVSAVTAVSVGGPWLDGVIRGRPSAAGPPARAVLVPLFLVGVPFALGYGNADGALPLVVAGTALLAAFWFIRTLPGALWVVRVVWPGLAVALAWPMGWPVGVVAATAGLVVAVPAWHPSVRNAVHPLVESGSRVPIPPELAPREVLDAADLDEWGRPR